MYHIVRDNLNNFFMIHSTSCEFDDYESMGAIITPKNPADTAGTVTLSGGWEYEVDEDWNATQLI
jgi:hypothetical protein